jgi:hypothetical protein
MTAAYLKDIGTEIRHSFKWPLRLPRNMLIAALCTYAGIAISIALHRFRHGLPYIAAEVFVWMLASSTACQIGMNTFKIEQKIGKDKSIKRVLIIRNVSLFLVAAPIGFGLIILASYLLHDWSKFWPSIILALSAVIINLGLGNLASVIWVYRPKSLWSIRKDRIRLYEFTIFGITSYVAAILALVMASIPALLIQNLGGHKLLGDIIKIAILFTWSVVIWIYCLMISDKFTKNNYEHIIDRLDGATINVKNKKLKKLLKA